MKKLGDQLRQFAAAAGLTNAEVARRAGLSEQRYGNYVTDAREPDLQTLVRICQALNTTPNVLLGFEPGPSGGAAGLRARLEQAARRLPDRALPYVVPQLEALGKVGKLPNK